MVADLKIDKYSDYSNHEPSNVIFLFLLFTQNNFSMTYSIRIAVQPEIYNICKTLIHEKNETQMTGQHEPL